MFENDLYPVMSLINEEGTNFTGAMRDSVLSDTWTHVLLMLELTKDDEVALYLNGVPNSYERLPSTFMNGGGITGENYLWFGGESATSDIYIDEVRIWNQEAVRTDILDRMCVPLNGDEEGLIGYWPMEDDYNAVIPATGTMSVFSGSPEFVDL